MDITCPHCHQTLEGDGSLAGETVTCPGCNQNFTVPKLLAVESAPPVLPVVRPAKKPRPGKWIAIGIPLVVILFLGGILARNVLRETAGQHLEDGDSPEVLEAEQMLLMDFFRRKGREKTDSFLQTIWTESRSERARHFYVPWACFMGREKRIRARIEQLERFFDEAEADWINREAQRLQWNRAHGIKNPGHEAPTSISIPPEEEEASPSPPTAAPPLPENTEPRGPNGFHWVNGRPVWN